MMRMKMRMRMSLIENVEGRKEKIVYTAFIEEILGEIE